MPLESTLDDIVTKLKEGRYRSEAAISTGIVLRVLRALNWQDHDTEVVWPEYTTMNGRVDFALCDPPSKPKAFVEVKHPGAARSEDSIDQALLYAFRQGVPMVRQHDLWPVENDKDFQFMSPGAKAVRLLDQP